MKNKILFTLTLLFGIFFSFTSVDALTKINFEETANGKINTTLHFEEGFVGGIDITFNITGDVEVKEFNFSDKITSGNYEKSAKYDKNNHTLTVRVTTGGIGTSHNLLNAKKELALGTVVFTTTAKENVDYKLSETAFKIVDNNWDSKTIEQSHITLGDKTAFVYEVLPSTTNPPEEKDPNENTGSGDENHSTTPSDSEEEKNNENNTGSNNNNNSGNNNVTDNGSDDNKPGDGNTTDDDTTNDQENNDDKDVVKDEEKVEKDSSTKKNKIDWYFVIVALIIFFVGILIYFLLVMKKRNKNTEE